ncbi:hypothetical protein BGX24_009534 [Mortierella sp. AD032]|nr:hypothetical protein BGX24_009534 [Mortierella sp. AD032]
MNNGAAIVYINMQEPCSKDLPPLCSAALAMDMVDESETATLSDDTVVVAKVEGNHALLKRNRHGHRHRHGKHHHAAQKRRHGHHKHKHNQHRHKQHREKQHRHRHRHHHNHDKNKHPYKDLCVAVGDFCGNNLYGCDFVATTQYRCDAIGEPPRPIAEDSASCGGTNTCLCPACTTGLICGSDLPTECKAYKNSVYDCSGGTGTTPKLSGHCEPGVVCRKDDASKDATCGPLTCECYGDREVCSESFHAECGYEKNTIYRCTESGKPEKVTECQASNVCISHSDEAMRFTHAPKEVSQSSSHSAPIQMAVLLPPDLPPTSASMAVLAEQMERNKCTCPGTGHVCGSELPSECHADTNAVYDCSGGSNTTPRPLGSCKPGIECISGAGSEDAHCGSHNCDCIGDHEVCSNTFPKKCKLDPNTIYKCTHSGKPIKVSSCNAGEACITVSDGSICRPDNCKCTSDGVVCGDAFPSKCNLPTDALYDCKKGEDPVLKSECDKPGRCFASKSSVSAAVVFKDIADDKCVECSCGDKGTVCTSTFPPGCNLPADSTVECSGSGATPTNPQKCENGACIVNNGDDKCSNNKCTCPDDIPVCGSDLPKECNAKNNTIYHCPGGAGTEPEVLTKCMPGTVCIKKTDPADTTCGVDNCECFGDHKACSNVFPDSCGYDKNAIYKCTRTGQPQKRKTCGDDEACVMLSDGAVCTKNDCKCPTDGDVCGSVFPHDCRIPTGHVYSCTKGKDPVLKEHCATGGCISTKGSSMAAAAAVFQGAAATDKCVDDLCKCLTRKLVCGSTFPEECKLSKDTLYECSGIGATPTEKETCKHDECTITIGDDRCKNDKCICPTGGTNEICGSQLPEECGAYDNGIYDCSRGGGTRPSEIGLCPPGVECVDGAGYNDAICGSFNCDCTGDLVVCSNAFPEKCGLQPNTIYKCTDSGRPAKVSSCQEGETCVTVAEGSICRPDDCKCISDGIVCGDAFPFKCRLKSSSLYNCKTGQEPVFKTECDNPGRCTSTQASLSAEAVFKATANDRCIDGCTCGDRGKACTSTFPPECNLPLDSIVDCSGSGATPTNPQKCEAGACVVSNGEDRCSNNKCTCPGDTPVCGSELPKECNAKPNTIYYCPNGKGTEPAELTECKPGTICNKKEAPIGAACGGVNCECPGDKEVCSTAFPDSCGFDKNAIYNCTSSGMPKKINSCNNDEACVILSDGAVCTTNDCKCPTDGDVCGSVFPQDCRIPTGEIYYCDKGRDPVLTKDCGTGGCIATKESSMAAAAAFQGAAASDKCVADPCKCQEKGDVCGSTFIEECKFPKDTLYSCTGKDATPTEKLICSKKGCVVTAGDDVCGSCLCPDGTPTCGSVFGPECKKDSSTLYTCSTVDALPSSPTKCVWGCDVKDGPDKCNTDCLCKNGDDVCGSVFPTKCGYKPGALYKCSGVLADPSAPVDCAWGCDVKAGPDMCNADCLCVDKDDVCGSDFPDKCGYKKDSLYKCTGKLADPTSPATCKWGCDIKPGSDMCNADCLCKDKDDVCGSVFPTKCNLTPNSLYKCSAALADPSSPAVCKKGCDVKAGPDMCNTDCLCKDKDDVCGSVFPAKCGLTPNSLYKCSAALADPSSPTVCTKGCDVKTGPDMCNTDCLCKDKDDVCGSQFPTICGLKPNSLYKCSAALAEPSSPAVCTKGCDVKTGPDMCSTDCLCKDKDDVCGSVFPIKCGYKSATLYKCSGALADPSAPVNCAWGCDVKPGSDMCNADCLCKDANDVCGSDFPDKCGYKKDSLYKCTGKLADPSSPATCRWGCDIKTGPDMCNTDCLCKDKDDVCGSVFPAKCGLTPGSLYKCSAALADPSSPVVCPKGCDVKTGSDKCNDDCLCKDGSDVCGSVFPDKCGLKKDSLYKAIQTADLHFRTLPGHHGQE